MKRKIELFLGGIILILTLFIMNLFSFFQLDDSIRSDLDQVELAVTIDGVSSTNIPNKDSGKAVSSIVCDKGATGIWDYYQWNLNVKNMKETRTRCQINFVTKYSDSILNGTDPELKEGLIPVTIEDNGIVKKASLSSEWYKYENKRWANAVILLDSSIVYANEAWFVFNEWPWLYRGGIWSMGFGAGVFSFVVTNGNSYSSVNF